MTDRMEWRLYSTPEIHAVREQAERDDDLALVRRAEAALRRRAAAALRWQVGDRALWIRHEGGGRNRRAIPVHGVVTETDRLGGVPPLVRFQFAEPILIGQKLVEERLVYSDELTPERT